MTVLLLGATGFAGTNVAEALRAEGINFHAASRATGYDLREPAENARALRESNPDVVINCAAHVGSLQYVTQKAADVISDNSRMVLALFEAVKNHNPGIRVIQPIANCAYPAEADLYREEELWAGPLHPSVAAYGVTRRLMLSLADAYRIQHGIKTVSLLTPNMYGPHDSTDPNKAHALNALASKFVKARETGAPEVEIWGTGIAVREWLYAPDFARIVMDVLKRPDDSAFDEPVNIAQEWGLPVRELAELVHKSVGFDGTTRYDSTKPDGAPRKVMSKDRFAQVFSDFKFTPFDEGILRTVADYSARYPY